MARFRVVPPFQVNQDGKLYQAGQTFEANDDADMKALVASEIIERVAQAKAKRKPLPSENKRKAKG